MYVSLDSNYQSSSSSSSSSSSLCVYTQSFHTFSSISVFHPSISGWLKNQIQNEREFGYEWKNKKKYKTKIIYLSTCLDLAVDKLFRKVINHKNYIHNTIHTNIKLFSFFFIFSFLHNFVLSSSLRSEIYVSDMRSGELMLMVWWIGWLVL